jgi:hypothetical protein
MYVGVICWQSRITDGRSFKFRLVNELRTISVTSYGARPEWYKKKPLKKVSDIFPYGFPTKIMYELIFCLLRDRTSCAAQFIPPNLISLITFGTYTALIINLTQFYVYSIKDHYRVVRDVSMVWNTIGFTSRFHSKRFYYRKMFGRRRFQ